ncbi:tetratricopeptide repeat protein [Methanomethylovorans sp.]|uniref:tetratricopeptide repeat protein n=1 Tax=Methanomethylovorans sp. TaxID=2758717 RepID=UPI00345EC5C2
MINKKIGVVIGNNYPNSEKELKFAVADAKKMKEILENKDICGFDEVHYLEDRTSKEASEEVEKVLKQTNNALILIYFSGHGKKDFENELCLLFKDTKEETLLTTSLTFHSINKFIRQPSIKSVIIVLDCCYSGVAGLGQRDIDTDMMEALKKHSGSGTIILTSTGITGSSKAKEDETLGHGIFTYYLIEGMEKGSADKDSSGLISIDDLYEYASEKTKEKCSQSPKKEGSIEGTIYIAKNPLKIRENEYISRKKTLIKEFNLPSDILDISLTILKKKYENSCMEIYETEIYKRLESLLKNELKVENYIACVQVLIESIKVPIPTIVNSNSISKHDESNIIKAAQDTTKRTESATLNDAEVWYSKGRDLYELGTYEEALQAYQKAIEIKSDHPYAWNNKGVVLHDLNKKVEALEAYEKAIEIKPDLADAWSNKGAILKDLGRYEEALKACEKAIEIKPDYPYAWYNKGAILKDLGKYEDALKAYEKAIEIKPDLADAWSNKGDILKDLGRYEEALDAYERAIEIRSSPEIWEKRANLSFLAMKEPKSHTKKQ